MNATISSSDSSQSTPIACATDAKACTGSATSASSWLIGSDLRLRNGRDASLSNSFTRAPKGEVAGASSEPGVGSGSGVIGGSSASGACLLLAARRPPWGGARRRAEADGDVRLPRSAGPPLPSWMIFASAIARHHRPEHLAHDVECGVDTLWAQQAGLGCTSEFLQRSQAAELWNEACLCSKTGRVHGATIRERVNLVWGKVHQMRTPDQGRGQWRCGLRHANRGPTHLVKRLSESDDICCADVEGAGKVTVGHQQQRGNSVARVQKLQPRIEAHHSRHDRE